MLLCACRSACKCIHILVNSKSIKQKLAFDFVQFLQRKGFKMSLLCWKYCPARESCGYMCSCLGRGCCVRSNANDNKDLNEDPLVNADQNSRHHVRRFSRSVTNLLNQSNQFTQIYSIGYLLFIVLNWTFIA